jgi:hypothetical protein
MTTEPSWEASVVNIWTSSSVKYRPYFVWTTSTPIKARLAIKGTPKKAEKRSSRVWGKYLNFG